MVPRFRFYVLPAVIEGNYRKKLSSAQAPVVSLESPAGDLEKASDAHVQEQLPVVQPTALRPVLSPPSSPQVIPSTVQTPPLRIVPPSKVGLSTLKPPVAITPRLFVPSLGTKRCPVTCVRK